MSADDAAVVKDYSLDTEVRYRDALDNSQVSDTFNVPVTVQPKPASNGFLQVLPALGIITLICIGAGYYVIVMRKKK